MKSDSKRQFHPLRWAIVLAAMLIAQWIAGSAPGQEANRKSDVDTAPSSDRAFTPLPAPPAVEWKTDRQQTVDLAKRKRIAMLWYFTGDAKWCPWCEKLEQEVFETPAFAAWADDRVALFRIEYPRDLNAMTESERRHWTLIQRYRKFITGYPTVLFLTPDEQVVGKLGYLPGGVLAWTSTAQPFVAKRDKVASVEIQWYSLLAAGKLPAQLSRFGSEQGTMPFAIDLNRWPADRVRQSR